MERESLIVPRAANRDEELDRANTARLEAEQKLRSVFDTIDQAFVIAEAMFDADGRAVDERVVEANPSFTRLTGLPDAVGFSLREHVPALADQRWLELTAEVAATGKGARFEKNVEPWGKWFEVSAAPVGDPKLHRVALSLYDISACKSREIAACSTEKRQVFLLALTDALRPLGDPAQVQATAARLLCEHLGVGHALYVDVESEADGDYYVARQRYTALGAPSQLDQRLRFDRFGASFHEDLRAGLTVTVADTESDPRLTERERAEYRTAGVRAYVTVPLTKQRKLVSVITAVQHAPRSWTSEDVALVEATAERTWAAVVGARAEASLRESEARLRLALDATMMGTFVWDAQENVSEPDTRMLALFGLPESAALNVAEPSESLVHPEDRARYLEAVRRATDPEGTGTLREDVRVVHPDGSVHWLIIMARMLFEGTPPRACRLVGMAADITERKTTEAALREREERLRESDRHKDEFLAVLAHELRNPLAPIRTGLELLRVSGGATEAVERIRSMMERQVGYMVRLIDDLLDVSRLTFGTINLRREPAELANLIDTSIETNRKAIDDAEITLRVDLPPEPVILDVDPTRFIQVVSNLLNNAVKFTDARGWIRISATVGEDLAVTVTDSGLGIQREVLPRVFDLFSRGAADTDRGRKGLGIGLALARRLIEMHGGSIEAFSEGAGRGSSFTIRLPLARDLSRPAPQKPAARVGEIKRRVVVIDDNRDSADTTAMFVFGMGCTTSIAYGGEKGLNLVLKLHPDLVLLDIGMPGMDGYEACRRMRKALGDDVIIVAMTGWGQERDKQRAKSAGFDAHLTKPVDPALLRQLLEDLDSGHFSKRHSAA